MLNSPHYYTTNKMLHALPRGSSAMTHSARPADCTTEDFSASKSSQPTMSFTHMRRTRQVLTVTGCLVSMLALSSAFSSSSFNGASLTQRMSPARTSNRSNGGTQLNMMFDQLSNALTEVAKNFGGKQRCVCMARTVVLHHVHSLPVLSLTTHHFSAKYNPLHPPHNQHDRKFYPACSEISSSGSP